MDHYETVICPICKKSRIQLNYVQEATPHFGKTGMLLMSCPTCGYRDSDIMPLKTKKPTAITLKVSDPDDLMVKVVKSDTCAWGIPELGVEVPPGPSSEGFITNIEGLLLRVENTMKFLSSNGESREVKEKREQFLNNLREAIDGQMEFTVILKDPSGTSTFRSNKPGKVKNMRKPKSNGEA